jgi:NAD(P)-dependent dehydrogenase (short-subunit alcohol dehydrogenase family)
MNMFTEQKPLISGFGSRTTAEEALAGRDLRGKIAIVSGGHAGLGLETTRVLANAGVTVVICSRDPGKAQMAVAKMKNVEVSQLDLASPSSIDRFANEFLSSNRALDLLINNAGIVATPLVRDDRGYEMQFATNHLGHFQLTARLRKALKQSGAARVVALSSYGHSFGGVDFSDRILTRDRMTNGQLTGNRRAQIHYLHLSLTSAARRMAFVRSQRIQVESSPILFAT